MTNDWLKDLYSASLLDNWSKDKKVMDKINEFQRKGHAVRHTLTPEELEFREGFVERWKQMTNYGIEHDYLTNEHCFECPGELIPVTKAEVVTDFVWDETEEEWRHRVKLVDGKVVFNKKNDENF